jgi:hypothetical protein
MTGLDLLLQAVALEPAGDVDKRGSPVEGSKQLVLDRAGPNDTGPADD